jgi:hypothetical protein
MYMLTRYYGNVALDLCDFIGHDLNPGSHREVSIIAFLDRIRIEKAEQNVYHRSDNNAAGIFVQSIQSRGAIRFIGPEVLNLAS